MACPKHILSIVLVIFTLGIVSGDVTASGVRADSLVDAPSGCSLLVLMSNQRGTHRFPSRMEAETLFREMVREGEVLDHRIWVWALRTNYKTGNGGLDREGVLRDAPAAAERIVKFVELLLDRDKTTIDNSLGKWRVRRNYDDSAGTHQSEEAHYRVALQELVEYNLSQADYDALFELTKQLRADPALHRSAVTAVTQLLPAFVEIGDPQKKKAEAPPTLVEATQQVRQGFERWNYRGVALAGAGSFIGTYLILGMTDVSSLVQMGASILVGAGGTAAYWMYRPVPASAPVDRTEPTRGPAAPKPTVLTPIALLARLSIPPNAQQQAVERIEMTEFPAALLDALAPLVAYRIIDETPVEMENGLAYSFKRDYAPVTIPDRLDEAGLSAPDVQPVVKTSRDYMEASNALAMRATAIRERLWGKDVREERTQLEEFVRSIRDTREYPKRGDVLRQLSSLGRDFDAEADMIRPHVQGLARDLDTLILQIEVDMAPLRAYLAQAKTDGISQAEIQRLDFLVRSRRQFEQARTVVMALKFTQTQTTEMLGLRTDLTSRLQTEFARPQMLEQPIAESELELLEKILSLMKRN